LCYVALVVGLSGIGRIGRSASAATKEKVGKKKNFEFLYISQIGNGLNYPICSANGYLDSEKSMSLTFHVLVTALKFGTSSFSPLS